jgi:phytoene dehydrogenase-like protein
VSKEVSDWGEWLKAVPVEQRGKVADALMGMPVETYADLNLAIRYLLSETIRGTISPDIMQIAIRVMEFSAVTVAARNAVDGTASGGMGALVSALKEAKRDLPKLEAKFSTDHPVTVIDVLPARRAQ